MNKGCSFTNCCICLYGNECMPHWNLSNKYTYAPRAQVIQRLIEGQYSSYRNDMIQYLKNMYGYEFIESNFSEAILKKYDFISEDIDLDVCPFCGGPAEMYITKHIPKGYDFTPRCKQTACCGRLTKKYSSRTDALHYWNLRIPLDKAKAEIRDKVYIIKNMIKSSKNLSQYGIQMIDTDAKYFSSYDSAVRYAHKDPSILFSNYSIPGETIFVSDDDGHICKYIIERDRSLRKIEYANSDIQTESEIYTKKEIEEIITKSYE